MSGEKLQPPRGTYDALPEKARRLRHIEETALAVFSRFGYSELRTPMFEATGLFARTSGETTDIVTKEMYTFTDKGGESMSLRPEGTAPVVRAYYSNGLKQHLPLKLCYIGAPMFRYERPQKGRFRQHHQVGVECLGIAGPLADVEAITTGFALLDSLGLGEGLYVQINSLGTPADRATYREALLAHFTPHKSELSEESQARLEKNPLRILDSKSSADQPFIASAPSVLEHLCADSNAFFEEVQAGLTACGIRFEVNPRLVRGLDYYTHTVFEIHSDKLGAQSQMLSGGRYDGLVAQLGGDDVPAVGFGCGIERLESLMAGLPPAPGPVSFIAFDAATARTTLLPLANRLRAAGVEALLPLESPPGSFKSQMRRADRLGSRFCVIYGEDEAARGVFQLKNMATGEQAEVDEAALFLQLTEAVHA